MLSWLVTIFVTVYKNNFYIESKRMSLSVICFNLMSIIQCNFLVLFNCSLTSKLQQVVLPLQKYIQVIIVLMDTLDQGSLSKYTVYLL